MAHIPWTTELETGIPFVDSDHRILVRLLNQVLACVDAHEETQVLGSVLNALTDYTVYHFAREEKLQTLCGFDGAVHHAELHGSLAHEVDTLRTKFLSDPQNLSSEGLAEFLTSWLIDHIVKEDLAYATTCRDKADAVLEAGAMRLTDGIGSEEIDWSALKVVVVEDNPHFRRLLETLLRVAGIEDIRLVDNALEALDRLGQRPADIVLCDVLMDEMDGEALAGEIFKIDPRTRVAFISALEEESLRARAQAAGVDTFLEKPITPNALFGAIATAVTGAVRPA